MSTAEKDPLQSLYAKRCWDKFETVDAQVQAGLYVTHRVAAYLKKVCEHQEKHGKEMIKVTKHEESKFKQMQDDKMMKHLMASIEVQSIVDQLSRKLVTFASSTLSDVVQPLTRLVDDCDMSRKRIVHDKNKATNQLNKALAQLEKDRQSCHKTYDNLLALKAQVDEEEKKDGDGKKFAKLQSKLKSQREKATKQFHKFEDLRDKTLTMYDEYYKIALPHFMSAMQDLEQIRLNALKQHLERFAQLQATLVKPIAKSEQFIKLVDELDGDAEINGVVDAWTGGPGKAPDPPAAVAVAIPCSAARMGTDQWNRSDSDDAGPDKYAVGSKHRPRMSIARPPPPDSPREGVVSPASSASSSSAASGGPPLVRALYPYPGTQETELSFAADDLILVLSRGTSAADQWWQGRLVRANGAATGASGATGLFPANYVEPVTDAQLIVKFAAGAVVGGSGGAKAPPPAAPPAAAASAASSADMVRADYPFTYEPVGDPSVDDLPYLKFDAGAEIRVINRDDPGWWMGAIGSTEGYFPSNMVTKI